MIKTITIERFKSIDSITLELGRINVLVGANNAGKSSVLQALQFATSVAQTAKLYSREAIFNKKGVWATSVSPDQLIYSPVKDPYVLARGGVLKEDITTAISISFVDMDGNETVARFRKGRNKNIAVRFEGRKIGEQLASLERPFCMYVPGLAGIPFEEEMRTVGIIRRIAAKGDSNTVFRNVLNLLYGDTERWALFISDLRVLFPEIEFEITANPNIDGLIDVKFRIKRGDPLLPIDLAGTGVLQAMQIAAYVEYFRPALLLLDEPDSHLHPNNQRSLSSLLVSLSDRNETAIIISTHSRHLMSALHDDAKFFLVKNGSVSQSDFNHYIGLLELGALDEYDRIKNGEIKYVILTEDSSEKSRKCLRGLLEESAYSPSEFQIYSYNSVSKIESARLFAKFLLDLNPDLKVILYRDRDGLFENEMEEVIDKIESDTRVKCIISKYNDIEMYYCVPEHLVELCNSEGFCLSLEDAKTIIRNVLEKAKDTSLEKLYSHRIDIERNGKAAFGKAALIAQKKYEDDPFTYAYGKKVSGLVKADLQERFRENIDIFKPTKYISDERFVQAREEL